MWDRVPWMMVEGPLSHGKLSPQSGEHIFLLPQSGEHTSPTYPRHLMSWPDPSLL